MESGVVEYGMVESGVGGEERANRANGWLSAPCDCLLTCGAALGEAVEAGAEQFVGLVLLPLGGLVGYVVLQLGGGEDAGGGENQASDWSARAMAYASSFAQLHPVLYLAIDLGTLLVVATVVIFEADLYRHYQESRLRAAGYQALQDGGGGGGEAGGDGSGAPAPPRPLHRSVTGLRRELRVEMEKHEEIELKVSTVR